MDDKKTVLVTGATGFIGSHVADFLLEKNYKVRCIYRKDSNLKWIEHKDFTMYKSLYTDIDSLKEALEGVDYVYHVGGLIAAKTLDDYLKSNRDTTKLLLEATLKFAPDIKRFIYVSSQTVAGPSQYLEQPINEDSPCNPLTNYSRSKLAGEKEVLKFKDKLPVTVIRPPAVYGPRDKAIYSMFKTANHGFNPIIGFNKKYISLIHVSDLARGIVEAGESDNTIGNIYNVTSETYYSWDEIIQTFKNIINKKIQITVRVPHFIVLVVAGINEFLSKFSKKTPVLNYEKGIDFIQTYWTCSGKKAQQDFGFKTKINLEDGFRSTYQWYKDNNWL